jgi:oxygen-independent coproporphyrinogen III oxidase
MLASKKHDTVSGVDRISKWLAASDAERYQAYSYSYPHKTAYRDFSKPLDLKTAWSCEKRDALFLYMHIPFCEMRCGFCNLFTTSNPDVTFEREYLDALERQADQVSVALGDFKFARMALGGGTPTYLDAKDLDRLFDMVKRVFKIDPSEVPTSVETSPLTSERMKLAILRERGVERVSIGVQSFIESEVMAVGRAQKSLVVEKALDLINDFDFEILNIDLMYGLPNQTPETWEYSLNRALSFSPEQIYLYPLYVRPLTGLEKMGTVGGDLRLSLYRQAVEKLVDSGYTQVSMRMFELPKLASKLGSSHDEFQSSGNSLPGNDVSTGRPAYSCQDDGMVGLGCGARSYTSSTHYSMRYAVGQKPVQAILREFIQSSSESFAVADYGIELTVDDQKRRYLIQSLLQMQGLSFCDYERRFNSSALLDFGAELSEFIELGLLERLQQRLQLTAFGLEWSDRIGCELYSPAVLHRMSEYEAR